MLTATRKFAKSPFAWALFALLIASFLIFGIGDVFTQRLGGNVVAAGEHTMTPAQFAAEFDRRLKQASEQQGQPIDRDEVIAGGGHDQMLEGLAIEFSLSEVARKLNLTPPPSLIVKELEAAPAFFSQLTGKFDKQAYQDIVNRRLGMSVAEFEQGLKDERARDTLLSGIQHGAIPPKTYGALVALNQFESRSMDYIMLTPGNAKEPPAPTDKQLADFMNDPAVAPRLRKAETRDLTIVRFSTRGAQDSVKVDPAELKKLYDFRLPSLSDPELRSFIQIPAKDAAGARAAADRLSKGEDPNAIAKATGVTPLVYEQKPKTAVTDAKVGDAAFGMKVGEVRAVEGTLGHAAIKVTQATPGRTPTLEEVRAQLELDLKREGAQRTVFDAAEKFQDALQSSGDLAAAARAAGATPMVVTGVTRADGAPRPPGAPPARAGLSPKLVDQAFGLSQGTETDVEDDGEGEYYVVRVDKITPAAMPTLAEVRETVTDAWLAREVTRQLEAKAQELVGRIRKGETVQAVAAASGLTAQKAENVTVRAQGPYAETLGRTGLTGLFRSKPGEAFSTQGAQPGTYVIGKITSVRTGEPAQVASAVDPLRQQLSQGMQQDMNQLAALAARRTIKVRVDRDRAHQALGLEAPADKGAEKGKGSEKKDKAS